MADTQTTPTETSPTDTPAVAALVHLPAFNPVNADTWFRRAEVQFRLKRVKQETAQADYVLAALPDETFELIAEWLDSKGEEAIRYGELKEALLQRFTPSAAARANRILQLARQPFGDQRPSDALLEMRALTRMPSTDNQGNKTIDMLRALWLQRFPDSIRSLMPDAELKDDEELRKLGDSLMDAQATTSLHTHAVPTEPPPPQDIDDGPTAAAATNNWSRRRKPPTPPHQRPPPRPRPQQSKASNVCYYHAHFGSYAR